jgi:3-phenylpropionate/trans-cinnamate dioxygenase ferredoxin component
MAYMKVADTSELGGGKMKIVDVEGTDVLLANVGGSYYAINNTCTHLGGSLGEGKLEGNVVQCPNHGSKFDVTSGKAVGKAKVAFFKVMPKDETSYPVKVDGTSIMVDIG